MAIWSAKVNYGQSNIIAQIRSCVWEISDQSRTSSYHRCNYHAEAGGHPIEDSGKRRLLPRVASQSSSGHPRLLYQHVLLRVLILNLSFLAAYSGGMACGPKQICHSCSSITARSTQMGHSGRSYDLLVSECRGCEPTGSSSRRLLCIAHGETCR